jgi:DNA polymerase-3 subunit alpha
MLDVLDRALEQAQRIQKDRLRKQTTMFDLFSTDEERTHHNGAFPPLPEWSEEELLSHEKESLGFYISRHPLDQFKEHLVQYATVDTLSILNQPKDREISIGGITHKIREINTRKGDRMCFLTLEDLKGVIEVIVFADLYKTASELLKNDQPLLVTGKVTKEEDNDTVKILASSIIPLAEAEKRSPRIAHLTLNANGINTQHLHRLKKIILSYPGDCQTMLHLRIPHKSETVLSLGSEFKVDPSPQFISELKTIFGEALHSVQ